MTFTISPGIPESELSSWLKGALKQYGKYKDGGVDYTNAPVAPVILCTVLWDNQILLLKRGYGLADAEGYWSVVTGFIDIDRPVAEIVAQELTEELALTVPPAQILVGASYTAANSEGRRDYIIFPCLVILSAQPTIALNEEHVEYTWIARQKLTDFHIFEDLPYAVDHALALSS